MILGENIILSLFLKSRIFSIESIWLIGPGFAGPFHRLFSMKILQTAILLFLFSGIANTLSAQNAGNETRFTFAFFTLINS